MTPELGKQAGSGARRGQERGGGGGEGGGGARGKEVGERTGRIGEGGEGCRSVLGRLMTTPGAVVMTPSPLSATFN